MLGLLFDIKRFALHDGPGIRTTVFFKGCPLNCWWCHNPESLDPEDADGIGSRKTPAELMSEIEKEVIFYDESGGGVTFSGGEPLMQPEFLEALLEDCKAKGIHTALDTTGCVAPDVFNPLVDKVDLFLYDLKLMDDGKHKEYTGMSNQYSLENLKTLARKGKRVIVRFPMIPGITDTEENVKAVAAFVSELKKIRDITILPYHKIAEDKYRRLKLENKMKDVQEPDTDRIAAVKKTLESFGLNVAAA